jgi:hypothetical protein
MAGGQCVAAANHATMPTMGKRKQHTNVKKLSIAKRA